MWSDSNTPCTQPAPERVYQHPLVPCQLTVAPWLRLHDTVYCQFPALLLCPEQLAKLPSEPDLPAGIAPRHAAAPIAALLPDSWRTVAAPGVVQPACTICTICKQSVLSHGCNITESITCMLKTTYHLAVLLHMSKELRHCTTGSVPVVLVYSSGVY